MNAKAWVFAMCAALAGCATETTEAPQVEDADYTSGQAGSRYPLLFVHGFNASPARNGFHDLEPTLRVRGFQAYFAAVPPFAGSSTRAGHLAKEIDLVLQLTGKSKVNLIGHSMGGLDARTVIARLGYGAKVASVTTIATPHRGSKTADDFAAQSNGDFMNKVAEWLGCDASNAKVCNDVDLAAAMASLSTREAADLNARVKDEPGVFYQSWAAVAAFSAQSKDPGYDAAVAQACGPMPGTHVSGSMQLQALQRYVADPGPNDGVVTVDSAQWGLFRGCVRTDHLGVIGQPNLKGANGAGFEHRSFYLSVATDLAKRGY
jgi:triacylglycerol lipase